MTNVLIVTEDAERGSRLADAMVDLGVNVYFVETSARVASYAQRLNVDLVVLDGDLTGQVLRELATDLRPLSDIALLPGRGSASLPGVKVLGDSSDETKFHAAVQRVLHPSLPPPPFTVSDYVQLACMSRRCVRLRCGNQHATGHIALAQGEVWEAIAQNISGTRTLWNEEAFRYWVTRVGVTVSVQPYSVTDERRVATGWEHLLLESMQLMDEGATESLEEWSVESEGEPGGGAPVETSRSEFPTQQRQGTIPPPSSQAYPGRARALVNRAIGAIMSGDYRTAEQAFAGALELVPDDQLVAHRLRKVREYLQSERLTSER